MNKINLYLFLTLDLVRVDHLWGISEPALFLSARKKINLTSYKIKMSKIDSSILEWQARNCRNGCVNCPLNNTYQPLVYPKTFTLKSVFWSVGVYNDVSYHVFCTCFVVMLYTSFATCQIRYVRVRYLHTRLATYWQSSNLAPSEAGLKRTRYLLYILDF